ncbi:MAG: ribonuclease HI [Rhizobiales bacterium]|nr:ribonuclease HI [Hyphomicrobiales bacterium]
MNADIIAALAGVQVCTVYCDGGCEPNPGQGGWGVVIEHGDGERVEFFGGEPNTTNNRMELMAAISALEALPATCRAIVRSDSQYVVKGIKFWIHGWKAKGWRVKRGGKPVLNVDLWRRLDQAAATRNVTWEWIRGHAGHDGNERADRLASQGRCGAEPAMGSLEWYAGPGRRIAPTPLLGDDWEAIEVAARGAVVAIQARHAATARDSLVIALDLIGKLPLDGSVAP